MSSVAIVATMLLPFVGNIKKYKVGVVSNDITSVQSFVRIGELV
jgi:hypothetical protein